MMQKAVLLMIPAPPPSPKRKKKRSSNTSTSNKKRKKVTETQEVDLPNNEAENNNPGGRGTTIADGGEAIPSSDAAFVLEIRNMDVGGDILGQGFGSKLCDLVETNAKVQIFLLHFKKIK